MGEIQRERPRLSGVENLAGKGVGEFLVFHLGEAAGGTSLSLERTTCRTLSCFDRLLLWPASVSTGPEELHTS